MYLLKVMLQCRFYNLPGLSNCWMVPAEELVPHILQCRLQLAVWFPSPINCTVCHVQLTVQFAICNKLYSLLCPAVQFAICNKLYSLPCPVTVQFAMSSKLYSLQSPRFVGVCFQWGLPVWIFIPHSLLTPFASSMHISVATHTHVLTHTMTCRHALHLAKYQVVVEVAHHSRAGSPSWLGLVHLWGIVMGRNLNNQLDCG